MRAQFEQDGRATVVAEATNGHEAMHLAEIHHPNLVVMDVQLPGLTGLRIGAALRRQYPALGILFVSMHVDQDRLIAAIRLGAQGYLTKDTDPASIVEAAIAAMNGENQLNHAVLSNPGLARRLLAEFRKPPTFEPLAVGQLSPREVEVLDCLVLGKSNREIGEMLFITEQTVKNHITSVLRKLELNDRVDALRYAVMKGWAEIGPQPYAETVAVADDPVLQVMQSILRVRQG